MPAKRTLHKLFQRAAAGAKSLATAAEAPEKGPKEADRFEVWHHHVSLRSPSELSLMLRLDQRR